MKLNRLYYVLLVILTLPSLSSAQEQSQWKDSFDRGGPISINGTQLSGKLFADMVGTVSASDGGYLFLGYWNDGFVTGCGPNNAYAGPMKLLFDSSGTSFQGQFGYCRENTTHADLSTTGNYSGTLQSGSLDFSGISSGSGTGGGSTEVVADLPAVTASLNWSSNGSAGVTWSTPIVIQDRVFLQDQDGGFDVFNLSDGAKLFTNKVANASPTNSPIYANGFVYMIADGLRKIDPSNGNEVGSFALSSISSQSPAAFNNLVYVADSSTVYGIDVNTMTQTWKADLGATSNTDVLVSENILYVFADKLYALNPLNGSEYWSLALPEGKSTDVGSVGGGYLSVFESGNINVKLHTYKLNSVRTTTPAFTWSASFGNNSAYRSPPVIDGSLVFATTRVGVLQAFKLDGDGTKLWEKTVRSGGSAPALPLASNGVVIIQEEVSPGVFQLVGYNGLSGTEIFKTAITGMVVSWGQPLIKNSVAYLATDHSGALYSIGIPGLPGDWGMIKGNAQLTGNSLSGVLSQVDETTLTIDIPQLYVPGLGVFKTALTLVDAGKLEFNLDAGSISAVNVSTSDVATFNPSTSTLEIPSMIFKGVRYKVIFTLSDTSGNNYRFTVSGVQ
ncbi:MAG: hypothetical protein ACI9E4_000987 [Pseudohongiellaceae bacterium]|jgi:hypothetical protein